MSEQPWLSDPKYQGMSPSAAQRSYEAWERQGKRTLQRGKVLPAPPEEIARIKRSIEVQLVEYEAAIAAAAAWSQDWKVHRPKGFRCKRRQGFGSQVSV